jgi:hypothetical protein
MYRNILINIPAIKAVTIPLNVPKNMNANPVDIIISACQWYLAKNSRFIFHISIKNATAVKNEIPTSSII